MRELRRSEEFWRRAKEVIMDGTQLYSKGPMIGVDGVYPKYIEKGKGCRVWDVDGNEYIDYTSGVGSVILGYCYEVTNKAIKKQMKNGINFGLVHPLEVKLAEKLRDIILCAEKMRFLKTGADCTSAAIRLARAYAKKEKIIKGEYHGWHDWCMAASKRNKGIPESLSEKVVYCEYGKLDSFEEHMRGGDVAAVILEPVMLDEENGFLQKLRNLCDTYNVLLIFDEVVTGFRFALGGAQEFFGVTPDLACFGKGIANGMPLSCVVGKREIFDGVQNEIFMSTTFGGETLSLASALANIEEIESKGVIKKIWKRGKRLKTGLNKIFEENKLPLYCKGYPSRLLIVSTFEDEERDVLVRSLFLQECVERGILMAWQLFPTYSHKERDITKSLNIFEEAAKECSKVSFENKEEIRRHLRGKPISWIEVL